MRHSLFAACVLMSAVPALAQAGAQPRTRHPGAASQTITLTGCVGGEGSKAEPLMLNNASILPASGGTAPGAVGSGAATPTPPSTAGTAATSGTAVPGAVAAGGTSAAISAYRLSGSDMKPWAGQHVEIVGSIVKTNPAVSSGASVTTATPEFRVQSVRPVNGPCPQ